MTVGVGMIPKDQVSPEQVESYMAQERGNRRELLNKFLQLCSASKVLTLQLQWKYFTISPKTKTWSEKIIKQVKVDTILIESDLIAKAIIDLIPILQIKKLVIGANKSQIR